MKDWTDEADEVSGQWKEAIIEAPGEIWQWEPMQSLFMNFFSLHDCLKLYFTIKSVTNKVGLQWLQLQMLVWVFDDIQHKL